MKICCCYIKCAAVCLCRLQHHSLWVINLFFLWPSMIICGHAWAHLLLTPFCIITVAPSNQLPGPLWNETPTPHIVTLSINKTRKFAAAHTDTYIITSPFHPSTQKKESSQVWQKKTASEVEVPLSEREMWLQLFQFQYVPFLRRITLTFDIKYKTIITILQWTQQGALGGFHDERLRGSH